MQKVIINNNCEELLCVKSQLFEFIPGFYCDKCAVIDCKKPYRFRCSVSR